MNENTVRNITVLGATGSIGCSTLDVISQHPNQYRVYALTSNSRLEELIVSDTIPSKKKSKKRKGK